MNLQEEYDYFYAVNNGHQPERSTEECSRRLNDATIAIQTRLVLLVASRNAGAFLNPIQLEETVEEAFRLVVKECLTSEKATNFEELLDRISDQVVSEAASRLENRMARTAVLATLNATLEEDYELAFKTINDRGLASRFGDEHWDRFGQAAIGIRSYLQNGLIWERAAAALKDAPLDYLMRLGMAKFVESCSSGKKSSNCIKLLDQIAKLVVDEFAVKTSRPSNEGDISGGLSTQNHSSCRNAIWRPSEVLRRNAEYLIESRNNCTIDSLLEETHWDRYYEATREIRTFFQFSVRLRIAESSQPNLPPNRLVDVAFEVFMNKCLTSEKATNFEELLDRISDQVVSEAASRLENRMARTAVLATLNATLEEDYELAFKTINDRGLASRFGDEHWDRFGQAAIGIRSYLQNGLIWERAAAALKDAPLDYLMRLGMAKFVESCSSGKKSSNCIKLLDQIAKLVVDEFAVKTSRPSNEGDISGGLSTQNHSSYSLAREDVARAVNLDGQEEKSLNIREPIRI